MEPFHQDGGAPGLGVRMIYLTPVEYRLIRHSQQADADLSRAALANAARIADVSVGRILTRLRKRGLIEIKRGQNRKILAIVPQFDFANGKGFQARRARPGY